MWRRSRRSCARNKGTLGGTKRAGMISDRAGITCLHAHPIGGGVDGALNAIFHTSRAREGECANRTGKARGCPRSTICEGTC